MKTLLIESSPAPDASGLFSPDGIFLSLRQSGFNVLGSVKRPDSNILEITVRDDGDISRVSHTLKNWMVHYWYDSVVVHTPAQSSL